MKWKDIDEDFIQRELDKIFAKEKAQEILKQLPKIPFLKRVKLFFDILFGRWDIS